ncbi:MAG: VF530 family protein [Candidatus Gracilibacteria bacterium]|nr:VF530 family protein [Candidatus Gracilibacteria bacterium]
MITNKKTPNDQPNDPLHGIKLKDIVECLVEQYSWEYLASKININCFKKDPSINSSLKFLRKTPWARNKVEQLYIQTRKRLDK